MKAHEEFLAWPEMRAKLTLLEQLLDKRDVEGTKTLLIELVSGYSPHGQHAELHAQDSQLRYSV
jgi:hypothetical protein